MRKRVNLFLFGAQKITKKNDYFATITKNGGLVFMVRAGLQGKER